MNPLGHKGEELESLSDGNGGVGYGIDIYGAPNPRSLLRPVISTEGNIDRVTATSRTTAIETFASRSEYSRLISASLSANADGALWSGAFKASYKNLSTEKFLHWLGLYSSEINLERITLKGFGRDHLSDDLRSDESFKALPQQFDPKSPEPWFTFLSTWGCYFVSAVNMGGQLNISVDVEKSFISTESAAKASFEVETSALFAKTEAEAKAKWKETNKVWETHREGWIEVEGGSTGVIGNQALKEDLWLTPDVEKWAASVPDLAYPVGYVIRPISDIFSGEQSRAAALAVHAMSGNVMTLSSYSDILLTYKGSIHRPKPNGPGRVSAALLQIDRATGGVIGFDGFFSEPNKPTPAKTLEDLWGAIQRVPSDGSVIVGLAFCGIDTTWGRSSDILAYMRNLGGADAAKFWVDHPTSTDYNYLWSCMVGNPRLGPAAGHSTMAVCGGAAPMTNPCELGIYMVPRLDSGKVVFTPQ